MNDPLYRIADKYKALLDDDDIDEVTFADTLEAIEGELENKLEACALYEKNLGAQQKMIDEEIARLKARSDALHFKAQRMRTYMLFNMQRVGKPKIKTALIGLTVVQGREHVVVESVALVPDAFCKIVREPMKREILAHLQNGNPITGAHLERGSPYLLIR